MMAAAATMTYLNYELINLVKGGLRPKNAALREEGKDGRQQVARGGLVSR